MTPDGLLEAMKAHADEYRRRYEQEPGPVVFRAADWMIPPMLADLVADGRPGTREELDRFVSEHLGYDCVIRTYDDGW